MRPASQGLAGGSRGKQAMRTILLLGAGKIGEAICAILSDAEDFQVTIFDRDTDALARASRYARTETIHGDLTDPAAVTHALAGRHAVISALPHQLNAGVLDAAVAAGVPYFDLTEDVLSTKRAQRQAQTADALVVPQCGLAPGFISILAMDLASRFDTLHAMRLRVGALPQFPSNALKYNLTWSTDGLINEYCNACEAIVDGSLCEMPPLEELERFALDGIDYEAFNTSGGLGTLAQTLAGRVRQLNYRTVRYPGHRDLMKLLLQDLRLAERRDVLKDILEQAVPQTDQDVVLIFVTATGERDGRLHQESYAHKVYPRRYAGTRLSAIQLTTASAVCAVVDLALDTLLPERGFVRQEEVPLTAFLANRFGRIYARTAAHD